MCTLDATPESRARIDAVCDAVATRVLTRKGLIRPVPVQPRVPGVVAEGIYELTLTTTQDDPAELQRWLSKIMSSAMFDVVHWQACLELTEAGMPHIHAVVYSRKKYLDASKVKRLKFPYRYELKRVRDVERYLIYIRKESGNPIIEAYCAAKGVAQFWDKNAIDPVAP